MSDLPRPMVTPDAERLVDEVFGPYERRPTETSHDWVTRIAERRGALTILARLASQEGATE